jgi:hypothetical protein
MTDIIDDSGGAAFPDGERLHEAFAEEIERPGLEGPSYDAVLRSGTARVRRRRVTVGATFALASVTAVATAVLATGGAGASRGVNTADSVNGTAPAAATSTTPAARTSAQSAVPASPTSPTTSTSTPTSPPPPSHPADEVLASGTGDGHSWQLVRRFTQEQLPPGTSTPPPGWVAHWCGDLNIITDGIWTNAGSGGGGCLTQGQTQLPPPDPAHPGFTSIAILDPHHGRLGTIVAGSVSPKTASITAQCGSKQFTTKPSQPAGDNVAYYTFTFPNGSDCVAGTLSFFDASGSRTAFLTDVALAGGK